MNRNPSESLCERTRRYLDSYIDGELLVETNHELLVHLDRCAACAAELDTRSRLKSRVRAAVRAQSTPPELAAKVRLRLRRRPSQAWWSLPFARWSMAAAAIAVVSGGLWMSRAPDQLPAIADRPAQARYIQKISGRVAGILRVGLGDHIHCSIFRKYPVNPPAVETMLADLGPYRDLLQVVNAAVPKTARVVMAHQCSYAGRKFVHVTLRDGASLISLVIARREAGESFAGMRPATFANGVPLYESSTDGYQVAGFETGDHLAFVISQVSGSRNLQLARDLVPGVSRLMSGVI